MEIPCQGRYLACDSLPAQSTGAAKTARVLRLPLHTTGRGRHSCPLQECHRLAGQLPRELAARKPHGVRLLQQHSIRLCAVRPHQEADPLLEGAYPRGGLVPGPCPGQRRPL